jgi:hypothetical protein
MQIIDLGCECVNASQALVAFLQSREQLAIGNERLVTTLSNIHRDGRTLRASGTTHPRCLSSRPHLEHWEITWVLFDAQAACVFSCSASKRSSFFQSVKVMAAILRASVRRAEVRAQNSSCNSSAAVSAAVVWVWG